MSLADLSIRRPVFAWMLMASLIIFGAISFMRLGVSQLPDVDFPVVSVSATLEGAAPEIIETDVIDPIEDAMMTIQGVRTVGSSARNGSGSIAIEFDLDKNIDAAMQEVQTKIAQIQKNLPKDMDPVSISKTNPEDQPILWMALSSSKMTSREMMVFVRDKLKDQFSTVPGVGDVFLGGFVDPNLRVWLSTDKLKRFSFSAGDVISTLRNEHAEMPAGRIETPLKEYNVRTLGEAKTVQEFEDIIINTRGGQPNYAKLQLKDVARVEEGLADIRRISRTGGTAAVGIGIRKQRGSNAVEVAKAVRRKMEAISKELPQGSQINLVFDSTKFIEESVGELNFTLLLSAILTALVCWLFLGSWSSTMNVVLAIPTSIVGTFIILYFSGFTLNTFTLLGLSLAIGIVVDDAIMVLENIVRHNEMGKPRRQAALDGAREITFAALAATISITAIFLPVAFMKGVIGKFFYQFGVTMTASVLLSLLEALTLTPMRCAQFLSIGERRTKIGRAIDQFWVTLAGVYKKALVWALNRRLVVVVAALVFFFASLFVNKLVNKEFMPAQDQSRFMVRLQTEVGSALEFTNTKFAEAESFISSQPEVERYFAAIGGFGGGEVNSGMIFVTLKPKDKRKMGQQEFMTLTRKTLTAKLPGVKVMIQDLSMRGFTASRGYPVEFSVRGGDWEKLATYAAEIRKRLEATNMVVDIDSDYQAGMPEVQITPDRKKAALHGVSIAAIGETVNALIGGLVVGKYPKDGHRYDVRLRLEASDRGRHEDINNLSVRNNRGELIPLSEVVSIHEKPTLQVISRLDRERAVNVFANVKPGASQEKALEAVQAISKEILPEGYRAVLSGSSQTFKESFQSLLFAMAMGLIIAYMVLASQFNSFIDPVTVLLALPFSISGAFFGLWVSGQSLNIYSMIGIILLMGIVKKNSILLVDFTNQAREGKERSKEGTMQALLAACPVRLRPIMMTSIATIAGAIPPALAVGPGAETRVPMAVAIIGGVIVSTILTLLVVPCAYSAFDQLSLRLFPKRAEPQG